MTLGRRIRKLREGLDLSQIELAARLSVANSTISQWEADKRVPDSVMLERLADLFNVSVDYLLGRTDDRSPVRSRNTPNDSLPDWLKKLPPEMQEFVKEESQHGWPYLRLARGLKMQDLTKEELEAIVETWMDAKRRHEREFGK
jgi:transcriptional regulator with XRE-family HTH domain